MQKTIPIIVLLAGILTSAGVYLFLQHNKKQKDTPVLATESRVGIQKHTAKVDSLPDKPVSVEAKKQAIEYYNQAYKHQRQNNAQEALTNYDRAIELNPRYLMAYMNRGALRASAGNYEGALSDLALALKIDPNSAETYNIRSGVLQYNRQIDLAIKDATRAIELSPKNHNYYNTRGSAYNNGGRYAEAVQDFGQAINLNPDAVLARINRATALYSMSDQENGDRDLDEVILLQPQSKEQVEQIRAQLRDHLLRQNKN